MFTTLVFQYTNLFCKYLNSRFVFFNFTFFLKKWLSIIGLQCDCLCVTFIVLLQCVNLLLENLITTFVVYPGVADYLQYCVLIIIHS